jgi:hypothetical protein
MYVRMMTIQLISPIMGIIELFALIVVAALMGGVSLLAFRARTLFKLEFRDRLLRHARGRIPPKLLHDFLDVLPREHQGRLFMRCWAERDRARLVARGDITDDMAQQMRNLLGLWPLARLRAAPRIRISSGAAQAR